MCSYGKMLPSIALTLDKADIMSLIPEVKEPRRVFSHL